jgi:hypothetical protein
MKEWQPFPVLPIGKEDYELFGLDKNLGNHYNDEGYGVRREDLGRAAKQVEEHVRHHLKYDLPNPNGSKIIYAINEAKALFFPALKDPFGAAVAIAAKRRLNKLNKI